MNKVTRADNLTKIPRTNSIRNQIYVGNLPPDITENEVEDFFCYCGKIVYVELKYQYGTPYAFVYFDKEEGATLAMKWRNGFDYDGYAIKCEWGRVNQAGAIVANERVKYPGGPLRWDVERNTEFVPFSFNVPTRRSDNRVLVTGLPETASWQDLKLHMREAGDVCFADIPEVGTGKVEYLRSEDMEWAIQNLNRSKFRTHKKEIGYIQVEEDTSKREDEEEEKEIKKKKKKRRRREAPTYSPYRGRTGHGHK